MKLVAWGSTFFVAFLVVMTMAIGAAVSNSEVPSVGPTTVSGIPNDYLVLYVQAASSNHIDWAILAAIGSIETDHGRSTAPGVHSGQNGAGAMGPMQFIAGTWRAYGRGGNVYDPRDAIPAAARYLVASGAPGDYHRAILAYNHAEWYYTQVIAKADEYRAASVSTSPFGDATAQAIQGAASQLDGMRIPYRYGGGHVQPATPNPGLDCSSSVSWVLQHAGISVPTMDSVALMTWGDPGPGRFVTIYASTSHTFMKIGRRYFGTSGFGHPAAGAGPAFFTRNPGHDYISSFVQRHPPGM